VDSLNTRAFTLRYKDLDASEEAAGKALSAARKPEERAKALNNLGFCAFMRMNFSRADSLYTEASDASLNQLERLIADIGHMKVSQRIAHYKDFCDHRNDARTRLRRIDDDGSLADSPRLTYARSELAITSSVYYYYLSQVPQSVEAIETVAPDETLQADTAQWLYYLYMRGSGDLAPGGTADDVTLRELDYLWPCLTVSYRQGYTYFDANASQALAEMMSDPARFELITAQRPALMKMLNPNDLPGPELAMNYARRALEGFRQYGDPYQISGALRTIATCYNAQGQHAEALDYLQRAIDLVNHGHRHSEWIARLREQLSVTYAALGMKPQSDSNRNAYLDLLDYTRQDKETESRYLALKAESERLNTTLLTVAVGLVVLIVACTLLNRAWRCRNGQYIQRLQHVATLCSRISSPDEEEAQAAQKEMVSLRAALPAKPSRDEQLQAEVMDAYLQWYDEVGRRAEDLLEERECVEKERYVHTCHLTENKQENLEKKACLLVVTGILPYIDRALYTMKKLHSLSPEECTEQLAYIDELLARINEHNDILAQWIKMKPGALSLHIETFSLQPLFDTVTRGRQRFEQRRQTLTVQPTEAVVKADKALTLFMINTLTDNARKYTQPGGHIDLRTTEGPEYVEVSVRDDGPGIAPEEVDRLMNEKVYDAGKGHGFGLMNCRGIIDKYRKTNPFFRVCDFGVESTPGQGSRFYFRLPKIVKMLILLLSLALPMGASESISESSDSLSAATDSLSENEDSLAIPDTPYDEANRWAELVYQSNVDGYYEDAILYADSALTAMNVALINTPYTPEGLPLLTLKGQGEAAELQWLAAGVDIDYFILLDVRNEAAVAFLALGDNENYRYNNAAYTALYKQLSTDTSLEDYCRQMQRSAGAKTVLLIVVGLLVVAFGLASYLRYFHPRLLHRDRLEEILQLSRNLLTQHGSVSSSDPYVQQWMDGLQVQRARYADLCLDAKQEEIDTARDEVNRLTREENRLHVQNRVLDNCLSALKHETVYYPHRIRQWVEKERTADPTNAPVTSMIELMTYYKEIYTTLTACAARQLDEVTFRRAALPVGPVLAQAQKTFARLARRQHVAAELQVEEALPTQSGENPATSDGRNLTVMADEVQLNYLLLNLFNEALTLATPGQLRLTACAEAGFVRFAFTDPRRTLTAEQLATLFDPHLARLRSVEGDRLTGVEYLIAKQVIRDHDAYTGRRGCRIQAQQASPEGGLTVWFTLPLYNNV
jgi:signal transduction histidine kinase